MSAAPVGVRKVFITGGPGSGKTTLSHRVAGALGTPVHELDDIYYLNYKVHGGSFESLVRDAAEKIAATDAWIAEGVYLEWVERLLREADVILHVDVPWRTASYRLVTRQIKAAVTGTQRSFRWRTFLRVYRVCRRYYNDENAQRVYLRGLPVTRTFTREILEPYAAKLVHVGAHDHDIAAMLTRPGGGCGQRAANPGTPF